MINTPDTNTEERPDITNNGQKPPSDTGRGSGPGPAARKNALRKALIILILSWLAVAAAVLVILAFTLQDSGDSAELSERVQNWIFGSSPVPDWILALVPDGDRFKLVRRCAHTAEYFLLGITTAFALRNSRLGGLKATLICAAVSYADQKLKGHLPGREFDPKDFPYDIAGYMSGIVIVMLIAGAVRLIRREIERSK